MKKILPFLFAAALFALPSIAVASFVENEINETEESELSPDVKSLSLDDVITRGLDNSKDLKVAKLNLEITKNEVEMATDREKAALKHEDALSNYEVQKESVKQSLTSAYFNLLILQERINIEKRTLQTIKNEVNKTRELYQLGRLTTKTFDDAVYSLEQEEKRFADLQRSYDDTLMEVCENIGVTYHPDIELKPVQFEVKKINKPRNIESLIENTNRVKKAESDLAAVILERDHLSGYERENQEYRVQIAVQNLDSTKIEVKRAIEQLYQSAEKSYSSYQAAIRQLGDKEKELDRLHILYNLGRIADDQYDKAGIGLFEAELKVYQTALDHYKMEQSIGALENGLSL